MSKAFWITIIIILLAGAGLAGWTYHIKKQTANTRYPVDLPVDDWGHIKP